MATVAEVAVSEGAGSGAQSRTALAGHAARGSVLGGAARDASRLPSAPRLGTAPSPPPVQPLHQVRLQTTPRLLGLPRLAILPPQRDCQHRNPW